MSEAPAVHEFSFPFDERFLRDALRPSVVSRLAVGLGAIVLSGAALSLALGHLPWRMPVLPGLATALVVGILGIPWMLGRIVKRTHAVWRRLSPEGTILYRLDAEALEMVMTNGRARHPWKGMRRLVRHEKVWLLEIAKLNNLLFPASAPEEVRAYLVERCQKAGVPIVR